MAAKLPNADLNLEEASFKHRQVTDLDVTDLGFSGPRILFCTTGFLYGEASRLLLDHVSKHLSIVLGRTELCHEVRNPASPNKKSQ